MQYNKDYLAHYGVLGMKWGVIRSRYNKSRANRLEKKAARAHQTANQTREIQSQKIRQQKAKQEIIKSKNAATYAKASAKAAKRATRTMERLNSKSANKLVAKDIKAGQKKVNKHTSSMTNAEMQQAIQRLKLEQEYRNLNKSKSDKLIDAGVSIATSAAKGVVTKQLTKYANKKVDQILGNEDD